MNGILTFAYVLRSVAEAAVSSKRKAVERVKLRFTNLVNRMCVVERDGHWHLLARWLIGSGGPTQTSQEHRWEDDSGDVDE